MELNTFSIAAYSPRENSYGVAVATARPNVGSLVPFVSLKSAIATQARVNTELGHQGLAMVDVGVPVDVALKLLLKEDGDREIRQVHGVTSEHQFAFTGTNCMPWCGHLVRKHYTVAGNMLIGPKVIDAMAEAFDQAKQKLYELSDCLLRALEAGQAAGGDQRGKQSAALLVASPEPRMYHNLRVDDHPAPVKELRRIYGVVQAQSQQLEEEYGDEGVRLFSRVKY